MMLVRAGRDMMLMKMKIKVVMVVRLLRGRAGMICRRRRRGLSALKNVDRSFEVRLCVRRPREVYDRIRSLDLNNGC